MKKIICMLLLVQSVLMMAQTETVTTINGKRITVNPNAVGTADNGLTITGTNVQFGGTLTKASVLTTTSAFTLAIKGLQLGTATDNVVVWDANGVLKYIPRTSFGGDNLGNHIATKDLDMASNNITNFNVVSGARVAVGGNVSFYESVESIGSNDSFRLNNINGKFGIFNASSSRPFNELTIDKSTGKTTLTSAQIAKGTDGSVPAIGSVATAADANGNIVWKAPTSAAGDNLGNHKATQDLDMSGKNINNTANITATTKATVQTAQIAKGTDGSVPAAGSVATAADANGNIVWKAPNVKGVVVPKLVAMVKTMSTYNSDNAGKTLFFDTKTLDPENGFSGSFDSGSVYTIQKAGVYQFFISFYMGQITNGEWYVRLQKNGIPVSVYQGIPNIGYNGIGQMFYIEDFAVGDKVTIMYTGVSQQIGSGFQKMAVFRFEE